MFASWPGNMRGLRVKTPLLLLLLLTSLTRTVLSQYDNEATDQTPETAEEEEEEAVESDPVFDGDVTEPLPTNPDEVPIPDSVSPPTDDGIQDTVETPIEEERGSGDHETTVDPNATGPTDIPGEGEEEGLSPIIILIPVVLVVLIIGMIVCGIFISRRWNQKARNQELRKEDPYLDGSSTEKVPMPMFEEDVPSVLELEMEELDQWMKKDGETADDPKHE
ncbi:transmembrane protein 154 [Pempheris klunzingeri]|uniref:transmembrane protein 154 n=1 Tax=Pempheris klunzingeri TaxID=3127111 RepID=UPI00397ECAB7